MLLSQNADNIGQIISFCFPYQTRRVSYDNPYLYHLVISVSHYPYGPDIVVSYPPFNR